MAQVSGSPSTNTPSPMAKSNTRHFPKPAPGDYTSIAAQYARATADQAGENALITKVEKEGQDGSNAKTQRAIITLNEKRANEFRSLWSWTMGFFIWLTFIHISGIYFFTKGFLLTRLVLEEKSSCSEPPIALDRKFGGAGTPEAGCWHPKTFDKAVVIIIDALRYDFSVPFNTNITSGEGSAQAYHNALPFLYETAIKEPQSAFLLPFIADPPTTTLQRLKGLTTGTLPTFVDAGSNFAGTAIEEDNLLMQLRDLGKRIVHLGDDTWTALFPGYFEPELSRAYESLNVWDLHTVDNGVVEHIIPLLSKEKTHLWDVMFAHFLGVDHAGHRYGPNHPAMTAKLQQMDGVLRDIVHALDDKTLLVVMGDHGMDQKGDHGGESDDEVEATLWMYSRKGVFGRTSPESAAPPATAKIRPVNQIDLVPTLALLLGIPIPYNNLGRPIEEAFAGGKKFSWQNLANAARMSAAGIKRYQASYYAARGMEESNGKGSPLALWNEAGEVLRSTSGEQAWKATHLGFSLFQAETLRICRGLWARFDVSSMLFGVGILVAGVAILLYFLSANSIDLDKINDSHHDMAHTQLEVDALTKGSQSKDVETENPSQSLILGAFGGSLSGAAISMGLSVLFEASLLDFGLAGASIGGILSVLYQSIRARVVASTTSERSTIFPKTLLSWLAIVFTISQSIGFASNSYTIWEDSILLFFMSTFGAIMAVSSLRQENTASRILGAYHSVLFVTLGWLASFSKLCREEQMPYCRSTYYGSASSSTSAPWQLLIPFALAIFLPAVVKYYYTGSRSYHGFAPLWISWGFRIGLFLSAIFWTLDAADDGEWFPGFPEGGLKAIRVTIAQTVFILSIGAGTLAFGYAPPCVSLMTASATDAQKQPNSAPTRAILGYANTHGTRYLLLVINIALAVIMVQKPMGGGAIALMVWQIISLLEIIDLNSIASSPIGPVMLALLGSFHFFKTGHQATLSSIQWESAFIPLYSIRYPYSPLLVALNSFGAHILAASAVPLVVVWKQKPRTRGIMTAVARALACHIAYYAVINLATTMWAGHLRRHLMLYRIFSPKFMMTSVVLIVVDIVGILIALVGLRWNTLSVAEVFRWVL